MRFSEYNLIILRCQPIQEKIMSPHLFFVLWVLVLSQCTTGYSKKPIVGVNLGDHCDQKCDGGNMICNQTSKECQCHPDFPLVVNTQKNTLCVKPAKLGEDCLSIEECLSVDKNSDCSQDATQYKAFCSCKTDYHEIYDKSSGKNVCVPEAQLLNSDLATLLGVGAGMTLFCGLTCLVLRIFARARFGPRYRYANAQIPPPPITLSTEQGEPRGQSRNSSQRSSLAEGSRRQSGQSMLLAPPSRQG